MTACVWRDVIFVLVNVSVCGALCEYLLSKPRAPPLAETHAYQIQRGEVSKRGGVGETERRARQDERNLHHGR